MAVSKVCSTMWRTIKKWDWISRFLQQQWKSQNQINIIVISLDGYTFPDGSDMIFSDDDSNAPEHEVYAVGTSNECSDEDISSRAELDFVPFPWS